MPFLKKFWAFFVNHIWPVIWPVIRDTLVQVVGDIMNWIRKNISEMMQKNSDRQQGRAAMEANEARRRATNAKNKEDKIRAEAEAATWEKIAATLKADNEQMKAELSKIMEEAAKHAEDRIESESVKRDIERPFLALPEPDEKQTVNKALDSWAAAVTPGAKQSSRRD